MLVLKFLPELSISDYITERKTNKLSIQKLTRSCEDCPFHSMFLSVLSSYPFVAVSLEITPSMSHFGSRIPNKLAELQRRKISEKDKTIPVIQCGVTDLSSLLIQASLWQKLNRALFSLHVVADKYKKGDVFF